MSLAIVDTDIQATTVALTALTEASLSDMDRYYVSGTEDVYRYSKLATVGDLAPDDQTDSVGWWIKKNSLVSALVVEQDPVEAGYTDVTSELQDEIDVIDGKAETNTVALPEDPFRYYGTGTFYHLIDETVGRLYQEHWKVSGPGSVIGQMRTTIILPEDFSSFVPGAVSFNVMKDNDPGLFTLTISKDGVVDPSMSLVDVSSSEADLTWDSKSLPLTGDYSPGDELLIELESTIEVASSGNQVDRFLLHYNTK